MPLNQHEMETQIQSMQVDLNMFRDVVGLLTDRLASVENQMVPPTRIWLSPAEFAKWMGLKPRTVTRWAREGRFTDAAVRIKQRGQRDDWQFRRDVAAKEAAEML